MFKKIFKRLVILLSIIFILVVGYFAYNYFEYQKIKAENPIEDLVSKIQQQPDFLTIEEISDKFLNALVATEDRRFYSRNGFDFRAFFRSVFVNLKEGEFVQGGSTIPQQVGKLLYFDHHQTLNEKVIQVFIMYDLESLYTKEEILEIYVNSIYFGSGYTGIKQASWGYYETDAKDLDWPQGTLLAGIIPAPSIYDPRINFDLAKQRQAAVLQSLQAIDVLTEEEADFIFNQEVPIIQTTP